MASASAGDVGRQLGRLFGAGTAVGLTDGELIQRFANRPDESAEAAFETILARHGAMVLTVCRQVLGDPHAAEDAFQATFLVLVRRAGSLRVREPGSLGPWLYGVAYRIALKARQGAARRRARERRVAKTAVEDASTAIEDGELQAVLHDEVNRLPSKYRAPVVLCYFEGRSHDEAAAALNWPIGTVRGRLSRARDLLRSRLTRYGLSPAGWIGASWIENSARAEVPAALRDATIAAAIQDTPAPAITAMVKFMLRALVLARVKMAAAALGVVLMAAGVGFVLRGAFASQPPPRPEPAPAGIAADRPQPTPVDRFGDPLPKHARARMGTIRFHDGSSVSQVLYNPSGVSLVSVNRVGLVRIWDAATGRIVRAIGDSKADFREVAASPDGEIARSPDGKMVATVNHPGRLRLWDLATGRERRRWHEAKDEHYQHLAFSPDGRTVAVGVRRYNESAQKSETFIDLWDTTAPTERRRRIPGDWPLLWDLKFSPDGTMMATATRDTEVTQGNVLIGAKQSSARLWDLATSRERRRFPVEGVDVPSVAFAPDGKRLACAVTDGTIRLYDLTTGQEREPRLATEPTSPPGPPRDGAPAFRGRPGVMNHLAFAPDGSILAAGEARADGGDSSLAAVHLWDLARGRELHRIPAHQQWVASLSFSPDGKTLASAGAEPVIRLWDVATGREAFAQSGHRSAVRSLAVSPVDGTVFTGGDDGTIRQWDMVSGRESGLIARLNGPVAALEVAPDGQTLLVRSPIETQPRQVAWLHLWSVAEHREIRRLASTRERDVHYVAYSPDGKTVASGGQIWDTISGEVLVALRHRDPRNDRFLSFCPIFYTPDGQQIITAEPDGAWIWDIAGCRELRRAVRWSNHHDRATLSPDGRFLATRGPVGDSRGKSNEPPIILWELASGQEVATIEVHGEDFQRRPFSPDGRFLASAIADRGTTHGSAVLVWDLATARELRRFEGHRGAVNAVAFTPDGRSVVSGSEDATALVWDVSDLVPQQKPEPIPADSLQTRWDELAGHDARAAYRAAWALERPVGRDVSPRPPSARCGRRADHIPRSPAHRARPHGTGARPHARGPRGDRAAGPGRPGHHGDARSPIDARPPGSTGLPLASHGPTRRPAGRNSPRHRSLLRGCVESHLSPEWGRPHVARGVKVPARRGPCGGHRGCGRHPRGW